MALGGDSSATLLLNDLPCSSPMLNVQSEPRRSLKVWPVQIDDANWTRLQLCQRLDWTRDGDLSAEG